jgi:hypothetical protein
MHWLRFASRGRLLVSGALLMCGTIVPVYGQAKSRFLTVCYKRDKLQGFDINGFLTKKAPSRLGLGAFCNIRDRAARLA